MIVHFAAYSFLRVALSFDILCEMFGFGKGWCSGAECCCCRRRCCRVDASRCYGGPSRDGRRENTGGGGTSTRLYLVPDAASLYLRGELP
jgi:hypothetical protein